MKAANPWLGIPLSDYQQHMEAVGQAQLLDKLCGDSLLRHRPHSFALIGCAGGNGLSNVDTGITKHCYAFDINPEYIRMAKVDYEKKIAGIEFFVLDIQTDKIPVQEIALCFIGLVLEYVDPNKALENILSAMAQDGVVCIVLQKSEHDSFVSKTSFHALESLSTISHEVDEDALDIFLREKGAEKSLRKEFQLTSQKRFILLEYQLARLTV